MASTWHTDQRWPDRDHGPYVLRLHAGIVRGRIELVGLELWAVPRPDGDRLAYEPAGEPITATAARIPVGQLMDAFAPRVRQLAEAMSDPKSGAPKMSRSQIAEARRMLKATEHVGRQATYGADHYAQVAGTYLAAQAERRPPRLAVAERFGVTPTAAAKHIARARQLGLLAPTTKGKAGAAAPGRKQR